ncbi:hypothetical protein D1AOALGA4SA_9848 [Olavius algarvensis Delta 1 endosymbiont]|nr:hypothetical protein D1AOALGA4SA_9848 [Olavius algarvensis Delta 1 endosymbiont]
MKLIFLIFSLVLLSIAHVGAGELKHLTLDDASAIGLRIQTDSNTRIEGEGSIKITTLWPATVCLGQVTGLDVENSMLIYRAQVKSELKGTAFLEMWAHIAGGQYFSKGMNNPIKGKSSWQTLQTPFMFQKGQQPDKVTLNLVVNGTGTVWVDDITLLKEALK